MFFSNGIDDIYTWDMLDHVIHILSLDQVSYTLHQFEIHLDVIDRWIYFAEVPPNSLTALCFHCQVNMFAFVDGWVGGLKKS